MSKLEIMWTKVDEAPALATYSLLPIVEASGGELMFTGDRVPLGGGVGMGIRESDTELRDAMDAAITSMKADGTLNALLVKWFGEGVVGY